MRERHHPKIGIIRGSQNFWGGIGLAAVALFAFWAASSLPGTDGFQFGPGTAPRMLSGLLFAVAVGIVITGLFNGPSLETFQWRGPAFVSLSILFFAVAIGPLGLIITTFTTFTIAALASRKQNWTQTLTVGIVITGFCTVLFPYILGLPLQLVPRILLG